MTAVFPAIMSGRICAGCHAPLAGEAGYPRWCPACAQHRAEAVAKAKWRQIVQRAKRKATPMSDYIGTVLVKDEADFRLLSMANEKRKFALEISAGLPRSTVFAFERGIDAHWFDLVDVGPLSAAPDRGLFRIFRLTEAGLARLTELAALLGARQ